MFQQQPAFYSPYLVCVCKVDNFNGGTKEADDLSSRLRKVVIWTGNVLIFLTLRVEQKGSYRIGSNHTQAWAHVGM